MPKFVAEAGSLGLPPGVKETGQRVDFKVDKFTLAIETKGNRLAWTRITHCPCVSVNQQTDQADPNCDVCDGLGWFSFKPVGAVTSTKVTGKLTPLQTQIVGTDSAIIRGIITSVENAYKHADPLSSRLTGKKMITVRAENKLGFFDKLIDLDTTVAYSQILKATGTATDKATYLIQSVNLIRSIDTLYVAGTDYTLVDGAITWVAGKEPDKDTPVVLHYLMHPPWRVVDFPHATRMSPVKFKTDKPVTPQGDPTDLPINALIQLEFIPDND